MHGKIEALKSVFRYAASKKIDIQHELKLKKAHPHLVLDQAIWTISLF